MNHDIKEIYVKLQKIHRNPAVNRLNITWSNSIKTCPKHTAQRTVWPGNSFSFIILGVHRSSQTFLMWEQGRWAAWLTLLSAEGQLSAILVCSTPISLQSFTPLFRSSMKASALTSSPGKERSLLYFLNYRIISTHSNRAQWKNSLPYLVFSSSLKRSRSHNKSLLLSFCLNRYHTERLQLFSKSLLKEL